MASGDTLLTLTPLANSPPSTNYATLDTRNGFPVLDFDGGATNEAAIFVCVMPRSYAGTTGVTVTLGWSATSATTGNAKWDVAFKSISDDADDIDTKAFAAVNSSTDATASASGEVAYTTITFTDGADMDSVAAGELFHLKVERDTADAADTIDATDIELHFVEIKET